MAAVKMPHGMFVCLLISTFLISANGEAFTALATLTRSLVSEKELSHKLRQYVMAERERLDEVLILADNYERHADKALDNPEEHLANPVNAYLFVKRFTVEMDATKGLLTSSQNSDAILKELHTHASELPDQEDFDGVVAAVLRLQDTYQLPAHKIADGSFTSSQRSPQMSANDCFEIGRYAYEMGDNYHTLIWMTEAWDMLNLGISRPDTIDKPQLLDYLSYATHQGCPTPTVQEINPDKLNITTVAVIVSKDSNFQFGGFINVRWGSKDCYQLGRVTHDSEDWYHTLIWMEQSLVLWEMEVNKTMDREMILDYLSYATTMQGNIYHARQLTKEWLVLQPEHPRALGNMRYFEHQLDEKEAELQANGLPVPNRDIVPPLTNKRTADSYRSGPEFKKYEALCRGEDIMPNPYTDKLKCYYDNVNRDPLLILAPAKVEQIYLDPLLLLYHDVVSDKETAIIKELATPNLKRATVNNPATGKLETASYRVSRSAWLKDHLNATVATLSKRISAMIHLDMEKSEELQVVNYGIGGQYEPHFDFARRTDPHQFESWRGNRIATWIYYFSDVEAGGMTVFTEIGVKVPPVKGGAAFWWNLQRNGEGDMRTRHAGCPVLAGSKWVANKWMHERGQEFMRPCGLSFDG